MTARNPMQQNLIRQAYALAGSLGYKGDEAHEFLHQMIALSPALSPKGAREPSLLALTVGQLQALCKDLRSKVTAQDKPNLVSEAQWRAVWAIRRKLQMNEKQFAGVVKHVTGLDSFKFLDVPTCRSLIAGMNKIAEGKEAKKAGTRIYPAKTPSPLAGEGWGGG